MSGHKKAVAATGGCGTSNGLYFFIHGHNELKLIDPCKSPLIQQNSRNPEAVARI